MLDGGKDTNGNSTWGLKTISDKFNIHRDYADINTKQQAGFCAEIVSTAKENMLSKLKGTGEVTYRADDRPDLFHRNDQFVDKIRVDADGNVIERIQTKFVGSDGKSWNRCAGREYGWTAFSPRPASGKPQRFCDGIAFPYVPHVQQRHFI